MEYVIKLKTKRYGFLWSKSKIVYVVGAYEDTHFCDSGYVSPSTFTKIKYFNTIQEAKQFLDICNSIRN